MQWNPRSSNTGVICEEMVTGVKWTSPSLRHELYVVLTQGTEISLEQIADFKVRAVCHFLIDQLPFEAFEELIPNLLELRGFHAVKQSPQVPMIAAPPKPAKVIARTQRPPIEFSEE